MHLAAESSVASSWEDAFRSWRVNVDGTVNVLAAVRAERPEARVLLASTCEVYGRRGADPDPRGRAGAAGLALRGEQGGRGARLLGLGPRCGGRARREPRGARPGRALRRGLVDEAARTARGRGRRHAARRRPVGGARHPRRPRRLPRLPAAARPVGAAPARTTSPPAKPSAWREVVELLVGLARVPVEVERDESRVRPAEIRRLAGDPSRLRAATGWRPEIPLEQTLADALAAARDAGDRCS